MVRKRAFQSRRRDSRAHPKPSSAKAIRGRPSTFHVCQDCGSTVYWQIAEFPDFVAVAIGGFADKELPAPTVSVYETRKHAWTIAPDGAEHMG